MDTQTICITGAGSGFGKLTALALLRRGHTVFATMREARGRNADRAEELVEAAKEGRGRCHVLDLDVTSDASVKRAVSEAIGLEGRIDALVSNAGIGIRGMAEAVTPGQFAAVLDVNVLGAHRMCRAVLPGMRERGCGLLLFVTSIMGRMVIPFAGPYTASKSALEGLAETYRYELAPSGIDVAIVEPGGFGTSFRANMQQAADEDVADAYGRLRERQLKLWHNITKRFQRSDAPDPGIVADALIELIEKPAGKRPLRTVIDPASGGQALEAINQGCSQAQEEILTAMGLADLLYPLRATKRNEQE